MSEDRPSLAPAPHRTLLERLDDGDFLRRFQVLTIDAGAIRERLAHRWESGKQAVWAELERSLGRRLLGDEAFQRISETAYLLGLVRPTRLAAGVVACHALQDALHAVLGAALLHDLRVSEVLTAYGGALNARPLGQEEIRKAAAGWSEPQPEAVPAPGPIRLSPIVSITTASGQPIDVMIAVQRILRLGAGRIAGVRASPHIWDPRTGERFTQSARLALDACDVAAIDGAVLMLARQVWEAEPELGPIMVPLSFHTLSRAGARAKLLEQAGVVPERSCRAMVCEILDLAAGAPNGRVRDTAAQAQTFSRGVFIEAHDPHGLKAALSNCRLLGLTFDASDWTEAQAPTLARRLLAFAEDGRTLPGGRVAHSLPCESLVQICASAGLSHAAAWTPPHSPVVHINGQDAA